MSLRAACGGQEPSFEARRFANSMVATKVALHRLRSQRLAGNAVARPADVVDWMGAVQAQDRPAALWAIAMRTGRPNAEQVERAIESGKIVRTWPMRGTLHFVPAKDVRWMLSTLAPRAIRRSAARRRELGLTDSVLKRGREILTRELAGRNRLTRPAAYKLLENHGVRTRGQRGIHILGHLAHEGILCLGPQEGKQPTFVLLDEWVSRDASPPKREDALPNLAVRYFTSHGPATINDFAWWSSLPLKEAREATMDAGRRLVARTAGKTTLWQTPKARPPRASTVAHLLPAFDEFLVAYKDRSAALERVRSKKVPTTAGLLSPTVIVDGQLVGTWTRTIRPNRVHITTRVFAPLTKAEADAVDRAAARYGTFLGMEANVKRTVG